MAKPNYSGEKRRKELERKNKKEEKKRRKLAGETESTEEGEATDEATPAPATEQS